MLVISDTPTGAMTVTRLTIKGKKKVDGCPVSGFSGQFLKIVEIILPLISL